MKAYKVTLKITAPKHPKVKAMFRTGCVIASSKAKAEELALNTAIKNITSKDVELLIAVYKTVTIPSFFILAE